MSDVLDVLIVGGGPVGACMGALLARGAGQGGATAFRVAILEPHRPALPLAGAPIDPRVVAVSRASERILQAAGAWESIRVARSDAGPGSVGVDRAPSDVGANGAGGNRGARVCAYERMRIWHESVPPTSPDVLVFDAADVGEPNLGYIVENRLLQAALLDAFVEAGGQIEAAALVSLQIGAEGVTVETTAGKLVARLVIGADGAQSAVRQAVGLTADHSDYLQTAIVATVATEHAHQKTAWQRFMRDGTLAFLPLVDGTSSIVWSADNTIAEGLLEASLTEFEAALHRASAGALGATRLASERASFPLRRLAAHHYAAQRVGLIGDAAHVVHPLAGQGVNLGLLDAAALAQLFLEARREREDPGALRVLRQYERWRKSEVAFMGTAIDAFDRLLAHGRGPLSRLAQRGLGWVNRSQELKRFFIARALGTAGELPRVAQTSQGVLAG
jgi:2-octaprenylphenol hydroxylase